jgi:hypothetical protein
MAKYTIYPNIYKLLNHCANNNSNNNACQNLQKLISIILQNAEQLSLTSGQVKLAFCFISKVKPVLHDTQQCLQVVLSELLVDYSPTQLAKIDALLLHNREPEPININNYHPFPEMLTHLENINTVKTQEEYNHILLTSCHYVESSNQIANKHVICKLVNLWFVLDKMF